MRHLALLAVLPSLAFAQLPPSTTWKYSVISGGGHSARFLLFLESDKPTTRKAREWWTLETSAAAPDGSLALTHTVRSAEGTSKRVFKTWLDGQTVMALEEGTERAAPLVTREGPPRLLSMERVSCRAPTLGISATCAGRAGGPLQQPELPLEVLVHGDSNRFGRELASFGAFLLTGGVLLPGTQNRSVVARLDAAPPKLSPMLTTWRKGPHTAAALAKLGLTDEVDTETLGALLVLGGTPDLDVVRALSLRALALDRWPLLRLARQSGADERFVARWVARLLNDDALTAAADPEQRALQASGLAGLDPKLAGAIEAMLNGKMPALRAVAASSAPLDTLATRALEQAELTPGEGLALTLLMSKAAVSKALPRFIERLPDAEGLEVIDVLVRDDADARRLATLQKLPTWVDRVLRGDSAVPLLKSLSMDEQRATLLKSVWARTPADARPELLHTAVAAMTFDAARLQALHTWLPQAPLTLEQRRATLDTFTHDDGRDAALRLLWPGLAEADRGALLTHALKPMRDNKARLRALQELATSLTVSDAQTVYDGIPFDDDRATTATALLPLVPEAARADFFVHCVTKMSFDDGKLALLRAANRPALNDAQRELVLRSIAFEHGKAAALLK